VASSLLEAARALRGALGDFEPGLYSGSDCARLAEELAATEKACAAARLLAAARAVETGAHQGRGYGDGASWLAASAGTTGSQARQALVLAARLDTCPRTREAVVAGEISLAQAEVLTQVEVAHPGAEDALLPAARGTDLSGLRDAARAHQLAETDPTTLRQRQFEARSFRHWHDVEGMVRFQGALPPETGLALVRRVERMATAAGRGAEAPVPFEARAADALVALVCGRAEDGAGDARSAGARRAGLGPPELVLVCDVFAFRRGHTHPGEVCHIIGGGPIPVAVAKELAADAFIKAVLHDGVQIHTVKHFGRYLSAALRTALDLGPVPAFSGRECVDCGSRWRLQYDHVDPVANHGLTEFANLESRCWQCHQEKTERDRRAGRLGARLRR
jgi:hypothetical protein